MVDNNRFTSTNIRELALPNGATGFSANIIFVNGALETKVRGKESKFIQVGVYAVREKEDPANDAQYEVSVTGLIEDSGQAAHTEIDNSRRSGTQNVMRGHFLATVNRVHTTFYSRSVLV